MLKGWCSYLHFSSCAYLIYFIFLLIFQLYKQGESAAQLAREYGIGYSTVHKWIQGQAKTQSGKSPDEIKAMEKRLASLSEENEILKKALGFLAQK
ncbi:transposase [Lactiplantibacillus plantarum]|uniref:transposase n=1 Tax=Lactiplantibacillus plantarum TaxID=1590 RepID=UPI003C706B68